MGVSKNRGIPKWMVYNGTPYFLMDDLGVPPFKETSIYINMCPMWLFSFRSNHDFLTSFRCGPRLIAFEVVSSPESPKTNQRIQKSDRWMPCFQPIWNLQMVNQIVTCHHTVDASEIRVNSPVEGQVVYPIFYRVFIHPNGGCLGVLNHQQYVTYLSWDPNLRRCQGRLGRHRGGWRQLLDPGMPGIFPSFHREADGQAFYTKGWLT